MAIISALCLVLTAGEPVHAGQLHVTLLDLSAVAQGAGIALVATVLSVRRTREKTTVLGRLEQIRRASRREDGAGRLQDDRCFADATYQLGSEHEFTLYEGVEWTDPHKSPADIRVRGSLSADEIKSRDQVVFVKGVMGWEALPWNAAMERKLGIFFDEGGIRRYTERVSTVELEKDLSDPDLRSMARKILIDRNALTPEAVVRAAHRSVRPYDLLAEHFEPLNHKERNTFLTAAADILSSSPKPEVIRGLIEVIDRYSTREEHQEAKSRLVITLVESSTSEEDAEQADWFVRKYSGWLPREQRALLDDRSEGEFLDWLLSEDVNEREDAVKIARRMTEERRAELLSRLLWGDRVREDEAYGETVASLAVLVPEAGAILTPNLRNDRAWKAAAAGLVAVGSVGVPSLLLLFDEVSNTEIRARAILVLQLMGPQAAAGVPRLVSLLDDPSLVRNAITALGAIGPAADSAVAGLEQAAKGAPRRTRREIVQALESIGTPSALEAARRL